MRVTIGGSASISIDVQGRTYPNADEAFDANWLNVAIRVVLPGYEASFNGCIQFVDFHSLRDQLKNMHEELHGTAELNTLEGIVELTAKIDTRGRVHWFGTTTHPLGDGAVLKFEFDSDQSYLPAIIAELDAICSEFPEVT